MSHYGKYLKEVFGKEIIEDSEGFATYWILGKECYIETMYVIPEARYKAKAKYFADQITEIAKEKGCTYLTTTINPGIATVERSMKVIISYDFKFLSSDNNKIVFMKELKNV